MKKFLKLAVACLAVLSFATCSNPDLSRYFDERESLDVGFPTEKHMLEGEVDASHQWEANEKLTKLLASFGSETVMENHERPKYPEYYGGGYITERGGLVVYVHGDFEKGKKAIVSVIGSDNIEFKPVEYSYAYLTSLMDEFNDFAIKGEDPQIMEMLTGFSLMDMTNEVEVQVIEMDERKMEILKGTVFNKSGVRFKASEGKVQLEATLYPGCGFGRNTIMQGGGSIGFRAKRDSDGKVGFVTAGHAIPVGATAYYGSGIPVGTCVSSQQSGTIDAAFVTLNNSTLHNVSDILCGVPDILSVLIVYPWVGMTVNKMGKITNHTSGIVISTNASTYSSGIVTTDLTSASYASQKGDSGGSIYVYGNSTRPTAGIHLGATGSTRYYTKAYNILNTLGLSRY